MTAGADRSGPSPSSGVSSAVVFEITKFSLEIAARGFPIREGSLLMLWDLASPLF